MYIEQSIKSVSQVTLRSDSSQFNQTKETFNDIFHRALSWSLRTFSQMESKRRALMDHHSRATQRNK